MANTKISQLPSWTGTAADLRYFVMNNSAETETYKFSGYTSQIIPSNSTNSYKTLNASTTSGDGDIAFGLNATTTGSSGGVAIGKNVTARGTISKAIAIGESVTTNNRGFGIGSNVTSTGDGSVAYGLNVTANNESSIAIGGDITSSALMSISLGRINTATAFGAISIGGYNQATAEGSVIIGKAGDYSNPTTNSGQFSGIFAGKTNNITSSTYSSIIGGIGNSITGGTNVIGLGLTGRTGLATSNTTYVENLHVFRTPSTTVQSISSGTTFTTNLNNGGKAQYFLTGNTTIDITNVRDGQSFMIKTQTDGNYTITWTATGYTFKFEGGLKDPGNTTEDIFVFEVFGTTIYGNRRHDYT